MRIPSLWSILPPVTSCVALYKNHSVCKCTEFGSNEVENIPLTIQCQVRSETMIRYICNEWFLGP